METSLSKEALLDHLYSQLNTFFPDGNKVVKSDIEGVINKVFKKMEFCFSKIKNQYFFNGRESVFNHLHGDQYSMFLYFYGNTLYKEGADVKLCSKIFLLNKALHGIDAFYEIDLPDIFLFVHPFGAVLGRAEYSDYLVIYQGCGVGSNHDVYPKLGKYVSLHPGSSVLGNCQIGENCKISAGSVIMDSDLEDNCIFIGNTLSQEVKKSEIKLKIWCKH